MEQVVTWLVLTRFQFGSYLVNDFAIGGEVLLVYLFLEMQFLSQSFNCKRNLFPLNSVVPDLLMTIDEFGTMFSQPSMPL